MGEFLRPDYSQWLNEFQKVPWDRRSFENPSSAFLVARAISEPLDLTSHHDYYQPERAARFLEGFLYLDVPEQKRAGVAYVTWMAKQETSIKAIGIEVCKGLVSLSRELRLPEKTLEYIKTQLTELGETDLSSTIADMVREAFLNKRPLAEKLREEAQQAEVQHPL